MDHEQELCDLLYESLLAAAAYLKRGLIPSAYLTLMLCVERAETDFHYTRPPAEMFQRDRELFTHAAKTMDIRLPDQQWYARFEQDLRADGMAGLLPACYTALLGAVLKSIGLMERRKFSKAKKLLKEGYVRAEQLYFADPMLAEETTGGK